ncbi:sugar ABC transporter ATP-binding protein [Cystobacter fuscus]
MMQADPVLEMRGISKRFSGVQALQGVDFRLLPGEVHTVMGQNGAGKSTLIKILTGVHRPDSGRILLRGQEIKPRSPLEARKLGISTVYQEVNLCPNLSVAENICLGQDASETFAIRWKQMHQKAEALLADLNLQLDVTAPLSSYSIAVQQVCAIARALSTQAKILILDEPTSSLAEDEVKMLLSVMRKLRAQGMAILFVTHFLEQVFEISDRITILRNGELVGEYPVQEVSRIELVTRMVGREVAGTSPGRGKSARVPAGTQAVTDEAPAPAEGPFLRAEGLGRRGSVQDVGLEVRRGKALGMGGLLGSGRTELARLLFGIDRAEKGSIKIEGRATRISSPWRPSSTASASARRIASTRESWASCRSARTSCSRSRPSGASSARSRASVRTSSRRATSRPWASRPRARRSPSRSCRGKPAEGPPRPLARDRAAHAHPRRADPRHRRGGEARDHGEGDGAV